MGISAVINTLNEEKNIERCLKSVKPFVDEIVVVDMYSDDKTSDIVKKYTKKLFTHTRLSYVEPARNFALSKASKDWILVLDADEELPEALGRQLEKLMTQEAKYYRVPHKNLMFGKWIKHSGWWPDYHIRFFKKGSVTWGNEIHSIPVTTGTGADLVAADSNALVHHSYTSIDQFITRMNRYTTQEVAELVANKTVFNWSQVITAPTEEFVRRYFVWEGYKDGLHGLALALLQAVSFLVVQLKLWEEIRFQETPLSLSQTHSVLKKTWQTVRFWYYTKQSATAHGFKKYVHKINAKLGI